MHTLQHGDDWANLERPTVLQPPPTQPGVPGPHKECPDRFLCCLLRAFCVGMIGYDSAGDMLLRSSGLAHILADAPVALHGAKPFKCA